MSSTIFANPFKAERPKVEVPKRRSVHTGQPSPDEISRADLDKHLRALVEGKQVDPAIEAKFNTYLTTGNSFGYLDDTAIRQLFTSYVKKQIADGNSDNILKFLGPESVFNDYIERKRFKSDSIESQLFDYVLLALKQKKEGKDPNTTPVSLTAGGLEGFVDHLTDKDKGLSYQSSKLDQLRTSSDPMMRLLREAATQLGLKKSIDTTKDQLRSGESSDLTKKLGDNLPDLLKKEEAKLNEIVPNGDLVVARKVNGDVVKVDKFDISGVLSELGPDAEKDFVTGTKMDFGDFIRTAQRLSLAGPEFKGDLVKHLSDGISLILAYHKAKTKQADAAGDKELAQKIQDQFRDISKALQGNGLLPENLAKIIRENVGQAILSEDFRNRAAAGDIHALSESLREQFMKGLKGDNKEIASLAGIKGLVESVTDHGDMITVIDPDSFATQHHKIQWVESSEIKDPTAAEENKNLTSNPSGIGSPISVERLVQSYKRTVDKACDKVFGELAGRITGKDSMVSKKAVDDLVHQTEEKIEASFASVADFQKFITESVIAYKDKKAHNTDATAVENALKKFVEETLNITDGKAKSDLWKATAASGGTTTYTPIGEAVKKIATEILVSPNTGVGDTASNAAISSAFESLVGAIKSRLGTDPASQEKSLLAKLADSKSKERVRTLMSSLRVKLEETEDLSKTLDLDKIVQVFEGTEGKKLQRALEDLSQAGSKFNDIKEKPDSDQFGEFVTLLFAKDDKGGIDESKRLTALVHLVNKAAKGDQALLASLSTHVASKLKGNSVKSTEETALSIRFKKALQVTLDGPMPAAHRVLLEAQAEFDKAKSYKDSITTSVDVNFAQTALDQAVKAKKPEAEIASLRAKVALLSSKTVVSTSDHTLAETAFNTAKAKLDKAKTTTVSSASEKLNLSDWINKLVIIPQQRNIVLKSAFQNMQRQLDNLRGHFSAIAMRHFGDQVSYASSLRPAVEDVIKAADSLDKDSVDSIKAMREALKNNEAASGIFESELNGLKLDPLRVPKTHNEHPGDLIDRIVNYLQSFVYNPSLSLWKSSGASAQSARSSESSRPTVAKVEEAKPTSEQSKALAS